MRRIGENMSKKNKSGASHQDWGKQKGNPMQDLLAYKAELGRRESSSASPVSLDQMRAMAKAFRDSIDKSTG
jgi:hypothetical protein